MCGICGELRGGSPPHAVSLRDAAERMATALAHRGPDDSGIWIDDVAGVALGHRRLAVIDVSPTGHQPMSSAHGRYVISFNGEIYNYRDLRRDLDGRGRRFIGQSDTEVLLGAIEEWGLDEALCRCVGMFALALFDRGDRRLHLARDRAGEKPLYYGWVGRSLVFGSELKALRAHPDWSGTIDRAALQLYLRYNYVPAPHSIYCGVKKLPPGAILTVDANDPRRATEPRRYWSAEQAVTAAAANPFVGTVDAAADELESVLGRAVEQQMVADVPLGAFLSGGTDSSTIVALMQSRSTRRVRTFTIGFSDPKYNEAEHARLVAAHLGTDHTELYVTPEEAAAVIPSLPRIYDEPFADSSQVPTFLVSRLARQHVTVALSGDGGDELFGGYYRYHVGPRMLRRVSRFPQPIRRSLARALANVSGETWRNVQERVAHLVPGNTLRLRLDERMAKLADVLETPSADAVHSALLSVWHSPNDLIADGSSSAEIGRASAVAPTDVVARMMYLDLVGYLPDDILAKVDRAAMSVSLETRVPFLDHRVIEFALRIPTAAHFSGDQGKQILRRVLYRHVPPALIERPKMGFGVPMGDWIRGPLRDWAESLLNADRMRREGYLNPVAVRRLWDQHLRGVTDGHLPLWGILMFQAWLEQSSAS